MVAGRIVEGSVSEIAEKLAQLVGERRVRVLLMDEAGTPDARPVNDEDFFRVLEEIKADAVSVPHVDDSREGIYKRDDK